MAVRVQVAVAALIVAALGLAQPAPADTLKLGNEGTYPPFSVVDPSGKLTGMEPELAREMCKRMGAECNIEVMDFKALIPSLLQGRFDVLTTQISPTRERIDKFLFSRILVQNFHRWVVPIDSHYSYAKEGLKGVRIGLQRGGAGAKYITDTFGDSVAAVWYDNPDQIKLELLSHRIDITFGPEINWRLELIDRPEGKDWKLDGDQYWLGNPDTPPDRRGQSWIVNKGNQALLDRINTALDALIADCTYTRVRERFIKFAVLSAESHCVKPSG